MADRQQLRMLRQGGEAWNTRRSQAPDTCVDLSDADLRRANLLAATLSDANLSGAVLAQATLTGAYMAPSRRARRPI